MDDSSATTPPLVDSLVTETPAPPTPPIAPVNPPPTTQPLAEAPPPPPVVESQPAPTSPPSPVDVVQTTKKKFNIFPFLLILIILAVLGVAGYFALGLLKKSQEINLTYWGLWEPESVMRPLIEEYQQSHPKVKISYQMESIREYRERLQSALSQNRGPDIFRLHSSWLPMFKNDLAPVPATAYSASQYSSTFSPAAVESLGSGSNFLAIPLMYDGLVMFTNDQLLGGAGLPAPVNWDDLRSTALTLSRCETETGSCRPGSRVSLAGVGLGLVENVDHWQDILAILLLQNNVNLNSPSGRAAQDVFDYFTSFNRSLGIWEATLPPSTTLFESGKLAIYFGPSWRYHEIKQANPNLVFSMHPVPQLPLDPERGEHPVTWATFWVEGVNAKNKNAAAAWDFLAFLSSKDSLQKLSVQEVALGRDFGEPFPRIDMQSEVTDPNLKAVLDQASNSRTWYLASYTFDGPTGINTRLSEVYANVLNGRAGLQDLPKQINAILTQYGLGTPTATQ